MKTIFTRLFSFAFSLLLAGFYSQPATAQTGVLNPNDPIVIYDPAHKPVTPPNGTLVKWVKTTRLSWNSTSLKCYYISGIPFRLKFPKSYSTAADGKTYPLYLFFHGIGEKGTIYDNEYSMAHGGDVHTAAVDNGKFDGFLLYPQSTSASGGWSAAQLSVIAGLIQNHLIPEVKVDPNRIIVNGLSGGGAATWEFVEAYPKLVAADIPMSGASSTDVAKVPTLVYNPIWLLTGGLDVSPSPYTAGQVANAAAAAGCDFVWKLYTTLAHNTWDSTWKEPDYFPFLNRAHKANPWTKFGRTEFCPGDPINVTVGVTPGFDGYEWRKDGVLIAGAGSNTINVTDLGTYDCRILRGTTWSVWSPIPVVIKTKLPTVTPNIQVSGLTSDVLPAPDGSTSVNLQVPYGYVNYVWQKLNPTTTLSATTNILTGATAGTYQVKVTEQYGCSSSFSNPFTVIDANGPNPPSIPTNLQAVAASQTLIKLSWNEDAAPANPETQFEIYQSTSSDGGYKLIGFSPANVDSFSIPGLNAKTRYYFKIRSINNTAASPATLPASVLTPSDNTAPTAPNNLRTGDISANSVELLWDSAFDDVRVTNYDIYVNGKLSYSVGNQTNYTVYNLATGQIYSFIVKARDLSGNVSLPSNQVVSAAAFNGLNYKYYTFTGTWNNLPDLRTLTPDATGIIPNVSIANRDQDDNFAFLWEGFIQIPVTGSYTFRTNSDDGSKLYLGALNQTASPYDFSATALVNNDGLHGGQNKDGMISLTAGVYPIAIAYYEQGGGQSITVSWKTPQTGTSFVTIPDSVFAQKVVFPGSTPAAPSNLVATVASAKKINLTWQDNSNNETGFEVYRASTATGNFAIVGTTAANQTSFGDSTCSPSTTYFYKIKSIGQYGSSSFNGGDSSSLKYSFYSNYTASTLASLNTLTPSSTGLSSNFSLGVTTATTNFGLVFDGYINIKTAGSYTFYTSSDDGSSLYIDGTASGNLVVNNDGLHGTTEKSGSKTLAVGRHKIRVMFFQQGGGEVLTVSYSGPGGITKRAIPDSVLSITPANATTMALPSAPGTPSGLNATAQGPNKANLTWISNGTAIINRFELWRSPANNANYDLLTTIPGTVTSFTDSALTANSAYYYKLRAVNEAGVSDYSNETSVTTAANPASVVTLNAIADQNISNDTTVTIALNASTDLGSSITYSATGLPSFATLTTNPDGSGTLILKPAPVDLGSYAVTLTATDNYLNSASKAFVINVAGRNQATIDINFNYGSAQGSPWNNTNVTAASTGGLTLSNLRDITGATTGVGLTLVNNWTYSNNNGMVTGNNSGVFPDNVLKTCYINFTSTPTQLRLTGLSPSKKYSVVIFAGYIWTPAQQSANGSIIGNYTIGSQTVTLDAANNTSKTVRINSVSPDASGNIVVSIVRASGSSYAIINAMQLLSYDVVDTLSAPYNLTASGSSVSKINLNWLAASDIRTGFEIWRSNSSNGTYSLLNSVAGNVSTYTDSNLTANTTYFYKVRAVNNTKFSAFSNYAGGSTVAYAVNLQFNGSPDDAQASVDWNNTNFLVYDGFTMENLTNSLGAGTGIDFIGGHPFNNVSTTLGVTTGNNSGPVPDKVMKTTYFVGFTITASFTFTGLNRTNLYNLVFYGGDTYNNTGTTVYQVGTQATTLNTFNNISQTATLYSVKPDSTGSITVLVYSTQGYGWINSVTLQAMIDPAYANNSGGGGGGVNSSGANTEAATPELGIASGTEADKIAGFPNPFIDDVTLRLTMSQNVSKFTVTVIDMSGRLVHSREFYNAPAGVWQQKLGLNGKSLNTGVYFVQVQIPGEKPKTFKLLKVR